MVMKIIAECGCNWKDIDEAKEMIKKCGEVKVDLVKFQLFSRRYALDNKIPVYLSVEYDQAKELFDYGKSIKQEVFFTAFDVERLDWAFEFGVKYFKLRFADRHHTELLMAIDEFVALHPINWFASVDNSKFRTEYYLFMKNRIGVDVWPKNLTQLFCSPEYPASISPYIAQLNQFNSFSDHTPDLRLLKIGKILNFGWVEKHVKLNDDCLESEWSVNIDDLGEVING